MVSGTEEIVDAVVVPLVVMLPLEEKISSSGVVNPPKVKDVLAAVITVFI